MTQQTDTNLQDNDAPEPLPQQDELWRAPARFGNVPVEAYPKGYDTRRRFEHIYPRVDLPIQIVERIKMGNEESHEPNRLIWGDNLHVMRQIPSNTIDLIYIDPPFFSGREYNVMWGDNNEMRSFNDIWEGGLDGYLIWLNARLYEMKRILKPTGSIYVHCDWHASHYIKVEMDKIFGYDNFMNEIIWHYESGGRSKKFYPRKHDILLFYSKNRNKNRFFGNAIGIPRNLCHQCGTVLDKWNNLKRNVDSDGRIYRTIRSAGRIYRYYDDEPTLPPDTWLGINHLQQKDPERIGYPTQKPETLLERIILSSSKVGDVVADFFVGGGTSTVVAQRLGRHWIAADQSRVAVAVTAERLKQAATTRGLEDAPYPDFTVEQWGIYEADRLSVLPPSDFRKFVLSAYGATRTTDAAHDDALIHGWHRRIPIWVGAPELASQATAADVRDFANAVRRTTEYQQANLRSGVMLAWAFRRDAVEAAERLRNLQDVDVNFIELEQVSIGGAGFRDRIVGRSVADKDDYGEFLTFVQPPQVNVGFRARKGTKTVTFDAGSTAVVNSDASIINVQWDFNYDGARFTATQGYSFQKGSGKNKKPQLRVTHKFARAGVFRVACKVQDSRGGEGMWTGEVEVK